MLQALLIFISTQTLFAEDEPCIEEDSALPKKATVSSILEFSMKEIPRGSCLHGKFCPPPQPKTELKSAEPMDLENQLEKESPEASPELPPEAKDFLAEAYQALVREVRASMGEPAEASKPSTFVIVRPESSNESAEYSDETEDSSALIFVQGPDGVMRFDPSTESFDFASLPNSLEQVPWIYTPDSFPLNLPPYKELYELSQPSFQFSEDGTKIESFFEDGSVRNSFDLEELFGKQKPGETHGARGAYQDGEGASGVEPLFSGLSEPWEPDENNSEEKMAPKQGFGLLKQLLDSLPKTADQRADSKKMRTPSFPIRGSFPASQRVASERSSGDYSVGPLTSAQGPRTSSSASLLETTSPEGLGASPTAEAGSSGPDLAGGTLAGSSGAQSSLILQNPSLPPAAAGLLPNLVWFPQNADSSVKPGVGSKPSESTASPAGVAAASDAKRGHSNPNSSSATRGQTKNPSATMGGGSQPEGPVFAGSTTTTGQNGFSDQPGNSDPDKEQGSGSHPQEPVVLGESQIKLQNRKKSPRLI